MDSINTLIYSWFAQRNVSLDLDLLYDDDTAIRILRSLVHVPTALYCAI